MKEEYMDYSTGTQKSVAISPASQALNELDKTQSSVYVKVRELHDRLAGAMTTTYQEEDDVLESPKLTSPHVAEINARVRYEQRIGQMLDHILNYLEI